MDMNNNLEMPRQDHDQGPGSGGPGGGVSGGGDSGGGYSVQQLIDSAMQIQMPVLSDEIYTCIIAVAVGVVVIAVTIWFQKKILRRIPVASKMLLEVC
jgi:uncharacterized membrane protein